MPDPFAHPKAGDPLNINAQGYSAALDAGKAYQRRLHRLNGGRGYSPETHNTIVIIKNSSGADRARFSVLGISGALITPTDNLEQFKGQIALTGTTPTTASYSGKFAILDEPAKADELAKAVVAGFTVAKINVTDSTHGWADVKNSDTASLASGSTGTAKIIWKESGTGVKWAYILIGASPPSGVDLKNNGTTAVAAATSINIPTTGGSNNILKYAGTTPDGELQMNIPTGGSADRGKVVRFNGTVAEWGFIEARPSS